MREAGGARYAWFMVPPRPAPLLLLACLLCLLPRVSAAAVAVRLDLPTMAREADVIVRGRVLDQVSRWDSQRRRILTDVAIQVDEAYKGTVRKGETIIVTRFGGTVGGIGMRVIGEATFALGEEAILFLRRHTLRKAHRLTVLGMAQGKLPVIRTESGPKVLFSEGMAGIAFLEGPGSSQETARRASQLVPLARFAKELGRLVALPASRRTLP